MANTTSGTYTFDKDFSIDEVIQEAFERLGLQPMSGNNIPSSGNEKLITSPAGTSAVNKVAPVALVVFNSTKPEVAKPAIIIPRNLTGGAIITFDVAAPILVACISPLYDPILFSLKFLCVGRSPH